MQAEAVIAPLQVANQGFLVASTIERCPKTMMLRELVMNALEAASAQSGTGRDPGCVTISAAAIDGVPKLRIWNTGRGLSAEELLEASNLSSSLFKGLALDGNFGMGAKVASLASNKLGLRYRACRDGKVSQIVLGQRDGVYGRVLQQAGESGPMREVVDVTAICRADGEYSLDQGWVEVVLLGNNARQDTVRAPFADNPPMRADWIVQTLGLRFFRLLPHVQLRIESAASGGHGEILYHPPLGDAAFDRVERVPVRDGIVLHYCYRAEKSSRPMPRIDPVGLGAVIYQGEVYSLIQDRRWALEAPTYGFTFATQFCSVMVELPPEYGVTPEVYRQFLRFREGDQRAVAFADFGELVRTNIPQWLQRIIESMRPAADDYLKEISADLQLLMQELGIEEQPPARAPVPGNVPPPGPEQAGSSADAAAQPEPPPRRAPAPPEIIPLHDAQQIAERGLGGRAARYYDATRQLFINTRYAAFIRLAAALGTEFSYAADAAALDATARRVAEWALIRRLSRSVIYVLDKPRIGWTTDELAHVRSAETLTLLVDDIEAVGVVARQRMAHLLGVGASVGVDERSPQFTVDADANTLSERLACDLAAAEAGLQRARAAKVGVLGPYYRRIALIETQRRNWNVAQEWLEHAIAEHPADAGLYHDLAGLRLSRGQFDLAAAASDAALELDDSTHSIFLRRRAAIEIQRKDPAAAEGYLHRAAAIDPRDPDTHFDIAGLRLSQGDLDGAAEAAETAIACSPGTSTLYLRRRAAVESQRRNWDGAQGWLDQAMTLDPRDAAVHHELAGLHINRGDLDGAAESADAAIALRTGSPVHYLRRRAAVETQRKNWKAAQDFLEQATAADPRDPDVFHDLAGLRLTLNDLDGAAEAEDAALVRAVGSPAYYLRRRAAIETRRRNWAAAQDFLNQALASDPLNADTHHDLAGLRLNLNDLDGAAAAADTALAECTGSPIPYLRRRAAIETRRRNWDAALRFLDRAGAADPQDPDVFHDLAGLCLAQGRLDAAAKAAQAAIERGGTSPLPYLRRLAAIEIQRNNPEKAQALLDKAIAINPTDPDVQHDLAGLRMREGDLEGAATAADAAIKHHAGSATAYLRRRAAIEAQRKDWQAALILLSHAQAAAPQDPDVQHDIAGINLADGDLDAAVTAADTAIALAVGSPVTYLRRRAAIESRRKDWDAASRILNDALAIAPDDADIHNELAGIRMELGEWDAAIAASDTALKMKSGNPLPFLRRRVQLEIRRRNWASADRYLKEAFAAAPQDPNLIQDLVTLRLGQDDPDGAATAIESALKTLANPPAALLRRRADIEIRRKNWNTAKEWLRRTIAADPNESRWHYDLSSVLLSAGDLAGAKAAAEEALRKSNANTPTGPAIQAASA